VHRAAAALSGALHKGANIDVPPPTLATLLGVLLTNAFGLRAPGESVGEQSLIDRQMPNAWAIAEQ
jgi:hypothetical protein